MSTFTQTITETFHVVSCYLCGTRFGINNDLYRAAVQNHDRSVHCPACGKLTCWTGKTEAQKLQDELARERQRHDQTRAELKDMEARRRAALGQVTKIRNRVGNGICPCCNGHFDNLQRHMQAKHPGYQKGTP